MNKISNIPFYNYNVSLKGLNNEINKTASSGNKCINYSNNYMSSDVSSASRAYGNGCFKLFDL